MVLAKSMFIFLPDVAAQFQQPRRALRARGCRSAAAGQTTSGNIFLNERSFFTFFAPLTCLDHIHFGLLLSGPTRYEISEKIRAPACPLFEIQISTVKVYVHDVGLCTASSISQAR